MIRPDRWSKIKTRNWILRDQSSKQSLSHIFQQTSGKYALTKMKLFWRCLTSIWLKYKWNQVSRIQCLDTISNYSHISEPSNNLLATRWKHRYLHVLAFMIYNQYVWLCIYNEIEVDFLRKILVSHKKIYVEICFFAYTLMYWS